MPTRVLFALGLVLMLCLTLAPRTLAKPPDLPLPVHPELTPEERPLPEGGTEEAVKPAEPEIFFVPLLEPVPPLTTAKAGEEEQEKKTGGTAKAGCPCSCPLCGPICSWVWNLMHKEEASKKVEPQQVFGSFDVSDLVDETAGNNAPVGPSEQKLARTLMRHIENCICPGSWESQGGKGGIEYNPATNSLLIRHDEEAQEQVSCLLDGMRQLREVRAWFLSRPALAQFRQRGAEEASSERESTKPAEQPLVALGFDITDLLEGRDADEVVRELVRMIETTIAPRSWANQGGAGRLDYNAELKSFFILQTPKVQEAIRELLYRKRGARAAESEMSLNPGNPIRGLLEEAHRFLLAGRQNEARLLVQEAMKKDRKAVLAHPLVYKMQLLHQVMSEPELNADKQDRLKTTLRGIEEHQANKDLKIAEFYRRTGKDGSACYYFRHVQRHYPNTDAASQAGQQLQQLTAKLRKQSKPLPSETPVSEPSSEVLVPHMPGVDPGVVHAYSEILEKGPAKTSSDVRPVAAKSVQPQTPAVLEIHEEACELEIVGKTSNAPPAVCIDKDGQRLRIQFQFGGWTFKLLDEGKGASLTIDWMKK